MKRDGDIGICLIGEGAMGKIHAEILSALPGVRIASLVAGDAVAGASFARDRRIPFVTTRIEEALARPDTDAVVIASPSGLHEAHAVLAAEAGKPALVEIPIGLSLASAERVAAAQRRSGATMMAAHTRRFSPAHRRLRDDLREGRFHLHHLVSETWFMRRTNLNMFGQPRSWTDNLLWHHACHSVDLAAWLMPDEDFDVRAAEGPPHPALGIAMDLSIGLRARRSGALVTMALSFNNKGPFGGFYRYIGEEETYHVFRDGLEDADRRPVPLDHADQSGFEHQDRAFIEAVRGGAVAEGDVQSVLPAMRLLDRIERAANGTR